MPEGDTCGSFRTSDFTPDKMTMKHDEELAKAFCAMSADAQRTVARMVDFSINRGACMGMDEGLRKDGKRRSFRVQVEQFAAIARATGNQ